MSFVSEFTEAVVTITKGMYLREKTVGKDHPETLVACGNLMIALHRARLVKEASRVREEFAARLARASGVDAKSAATYRANMLQVRLAAREHEQVLAESAELYSDCRRLWPEDGGPSGRKVAQAAIAACTALGRSEEAAAWRERSAPRSAGAGR